MQRPDCPELDTLLASVEELRAAESHLAALKAKIAQDAQGLSKIVNKAERIAAGVYAYWYAPEAHASDIALGTTGRTHPGRLLKLGGPVSVGVPCDRCQADLPIHSRNQMKETLDRLRGGYRWPEGYRVLCFTCEEAIHDGRRVEQTRLDRERDQRERELAALPYADYLQTDDWRDAKSAFLWFRAQEYQALSCETCNGEGDRGVYHKSLERLGGGDDLVLLCAGCRDALRKANRMAGEPGPANLLSPAEADAILSHLEAERIGAQG